MAQRQFRSDDTSKWTLSFGAGSAGAKTYSADHTLDAGDAFYNNTLTGSASATTGTTGLSTATYNLPCIIHQTQGTGFGNWEINFLTTVSSGTATFTFPLMNTYNTGAQIVTANPYSAITINSGVSLFVPAWNGSYGGIAFLMCSGVITVTGSINVIGVGFRGGAGSAGASNAAASAFYGESGSGASAQLNNSAAGNGAGGGAGTGGDGGSGGGGGGNAAVGTVGQNGQGNGGAAGTVSGITTNLITLVPGGGGGGGKGESNAASGQGQGGNGGNGGGIVMLFGRTVTVTGAINASGAVGSNAGFSANEGGGGGGAGAGGAVLIKGQIVTIGSSLVLVSGNSGGARGGGASGAGGGSGNGQVHVDYGATFSGSTSPLDTTQDGSLNDTGGAFLFNVL